MVSVVPRVPYCTEYSSSIFYGTVLVVILLGRCVESGCATQIEYPVPDTHMVARVYVNHLFNLKKKHISLGKGTKVLVCVCVFSSHSFWTSMDVPAGVIQEEGNTGFSIHLLSAVLALIFLARRIQPFLSLVDREVEFCVPTI